MDLGFEKTGYDVIFVDELSQPFLHTYEYSRDKMGMQPPKYGYSNIDVNKYIGKRKKGLKEQIKKEHGEGRLVGFIGGPPCPDFSVGGKNKLLKRKSMNRAQLDNMESDYYLLYQEEEHRR